MRCSWKSVALNLTNYHLEKEVTNHVAAIETAEQHIKELQFKLKHFKRFINGLSGPDRIYYSDRYKYNHERLNDRLDKLIFEEVAEIEEATKYHFKLDEPNFMFKFGNTTPAAHPSLTELEADPEDHFKAMLEQLGVT